jgi:cell division protein FtsW
MGGGIGMKTTRGAVYYDPCLLACALSLVAVGLLMVASVSMVISDRLYHHAFHFVSHQAVYAALAVCVAWVVSRCPMHWWSSLSAYALLLSFVLLVLVLIPGIGRTVNGSRRWMSLGFMAFQVSEFAKLALVVYFASYVVRRGHYMRQHMHELLKPMAVLGVLVLLLLCEPDYGTAAVVLLTVLGMLFLGGMRWWYFAALFALVAVVLVVMVWVSPYRLARLSSFLHPWQTPYTSGYQLIQSLIAVGRGGFWGVGLGNSIQKLFYLPEAHTDFMFAILTEEMGFLGALAVLALYVVLVARTFWVACQAHKQDMLFHAFVAYGIGLWLALQAAINIGVNIGLLPTKGITLPLMSYGGSSLLISAMAVAVVLRVAHEARYGVGRYV